MIKSRFRLFLLLLCASLVMGHGVAHANDHGHKKDHDHPVEGLLSLPHPIRILISPEWSARLSDEQKIAIEELKRKIQPRYMGLMGEAYPIEQSLLKSSLEFVNSVPEYQQKLQRLADLKRQMSTVQMAAYAELKEILGEAVWQQLMDELLSHG
jgi:hypothetical protein